VHKGSGTAGDVYEQLSLVICIHEIFSVMCAGTQLRTVSIPAMSPSLNDQGVKGDEIVSAEQHVETRLMPTGPELDPSELAREGHKRQICYRPPRALCSFIMRLFKGSVCCNRCSTWARAYLVLPLHLNGRFRCADPSDLGRAAQQLDFNPDAEKAP
jgi:hypothetical protein